MPYIDEYYAAQQPRDNDIPQPMGHQPDASAVTGAGRANIEGGWRERTEDWINRNLLSGGATDIRNLAAAAGPAVQAAGGLGRALNWGSRVGMPAKAPAAVDAADQMFDVARAAPVMRAQAGNIDPRLAYALGGGGLAAAGALYGWATSPEEQPTPPPPNAGVGVSAPAAAKVLSSRAQIIEASTDATLMTPAAFKAKWGGLPEQVIPR